MEFCFRIFLNVCDAVKNVKLADQGMNDLFDRTLLML